MPENKRDNLLGRYFAGRKEPNPTKPGLKQTPSPPAPLAQTHGIVSIAGGDWTVDDPIHIFDVAHHGVRRMPTYRNTAEAVSKLTPSSIARRRLMGPSVPFSNELGQQEVWSLHRSFQQAAIRMLRQARQRNGMTEFMETSCARQSLKCTSRLRSRLLKIPKA